MYTQMVSYNLNGKSSENGQISNIYDDMNLVASSSSLTPPHTTNNHDAIGKNDLCGVCTEIAHGMHFGALTCRACAAFFRRTIVNNATFTCRTGRNDCDISPKAKNECKQCRYNKCIQIGMTPLNVQFNRDRNSSTEPKRGNRSKSRNLKSASEEDRRSSSNIPSPPRITGHRSRLSKYDKFRAVRPRLNKIFDKPTVSDEIITSSWLDTMEHALSKKRTSVSRNPPMIQFMKIMDWKPLLYEQQCQLAEYLMECKPFTKLSNDQKWLLYESHHEQIFVLERIHISMELFGERTLTEKLVLYVNGFCTQRHSFKMDISAISDHDSDYVNGLLNPFRNADRIFESFNELKPDLAEINYLMMQTLWNVEEINVSQETQEIADGVRERFSDELHKYYSHELGINNYADRLHRLMNLVHDVREVIDNKNQMMELALLFDVFKIADDKDPGCPNIYEVPLTPPRSN